MSEPQSNPFFKIGKAHTLNVNSVNRANMLIEVNPRMAESLVAFVNSVEDDTNDPIEPAIITMSGMLEKWLDHREQRRIDEQRHTDALADMAAV